MTKEILMEAGLTEEKALQVLAKASQDGEISEETPIQSLNKALNDDGHQSIEDLIKAKKEDDGEEEENYDADYMKKYMKRYMKENPSACKKMIENMGEKEKEMKKAVDDIDLDSDGVIAQMDDFKPFMDAQTSFNEALVKAVEAVSEKIDTVISADARTLDVLEKAARVTVDTADTLNKISSTPSGRKGVTANVELAKATPVTQAKKLTPAQSNQIYVALEKAVKTGDRKAGSVIGVFESCGRNVSMLSKDHQAYIGNLLTQEAK